MRDKGYPHPLHSLDLITPGSPPPEEARYGVPVPHGLLVVHPNLRLRGARMTSTNCEDTVLRALGFHKQRVDIYASHGLTPEWADNMIYWKDQMDSLEMDRSRAEIGGRFNLQSREGVAEVVFRLWRRLCLAADLANVGSAVTLGRLPRGQAERLDRLDLVITQAQAPGVADLLAEYGFGPPELELLEESTEDLRKRRRHVQGLQRARQQCGDQVSVVRGALLGDVARFSKVAQRYLPAWQEPNVQMQHLLPRPRRRRAARAEQPAGQQAMAGPAGPPAQTGQEPSPGDGGA